MRMLPALALAGLVGGAAHADDLNCSQIKLVAPLPKRDESLIELPRRTGTSHRGDTLVSQLTSL